MKSQTRMAKLRGLKFAVSSFLMTFIDRAGSSATVSKPTDMDIIPDSMDVAGTSTITNKTTVSKPTDMDIISDLTHPLHGWKLPWQLKYDSNDEYGFYMC